MAGNTGKSEAEAMEELARQMWERYFKYKASDLLEHSLDGYKATVARNNGDGTLSVTRPYDDTEVTLKCPPSLAANAGAGDQVLVITLGNLSNAFILCKTDLTGLGGGGDMLRPEEYDFSTIPTSDYFLETLENGATTRYNIEIDESGRIVSITDTTDGFETTINWGSLNWKDQADEVDYDNTSSGLTATNVQAALDELANGGGGGVPSPSDSTPQGLGTASAGTSSNYSRGDHVHQMPSASDVGAQPTITASGILKGDGSGGVSAAVSGTDYATPASIPSAYASNPEMDGTASPGSSGSWAKGDHVHPSDTTKANQAQLAYVESGSTASKNYTEGEYFCWNGGLYRATAAISSGASFVAGTSGNCANIRAMDYYSSTWTPANVTIPTNVIPRNCFVRSGGFLAIYFAMVLSADLASYGTVEVCSDVATTFGVSNVLTPFVNAPAFSTFSSNSQPDIVMRIQYYNNKITLINRTGATVPAANRAIYAWMLLGI